MKKMMIMAVLMIAQIALAGPVAREVKHASRESHLTELSKDVSFKEAREKIKAGKELTAKERSSLDKATESALQGIEVSAINIKAMVYAKPEILADIKVRTEIIKSSTSTKEQIDQAVIDLKVLDTGGRALDPNAPNFKSDFEIVETVAFVQNFPNSTVYSFKVEFNKVVDNGKAIEQAVTIASKNKFDAKKLKELCI